MKHLILFFTRRGQNYVGESIVDLKKGNAEVLAEYINEAVDGELFEIVTVKSYSDDYETCTQEAKTELREGARPRLRNYVDDISDYDHIFIVAPNWWGIYPMAVYSQIEKLDFTGHKVHYVVTHEGSGLGSVPKTLSVYCKGADIGHGLAVQGSNVDSSQEEVKAWARKAVESD